MSGVSDEPSGPLHRSFGARLVVALAVLALVAGPGFFAAALLIALYRDVPPSPVSTKDDKPAVVALKAKTPDGQLSPVAERLAPGFELPSISGAPGPVSNNPVTAYLTLTGTSNYTTLGTDRAEPAEKGYRTVCVRLCDGSYFPISERAIPGDFAADEVQCRSRCGSPARLYVYKNGQETPLQMRDLSGSSYLELPTAFLFHTGYHAQCTCRSQPWTLASRKRHHRYARLKTAGQAKKIAVTAVALAQNTRSPAVRELQAIRALSGIPKSQSMRETAPLQIAAAEWSGPLPSIKARAATAQEMARIEAEQKTAERIALVSARADLLASLELPNRIGPRHLPKRLKESVGTTAGQLKLETTAPFGLGGPQVSSPVKVADVSINEPPVPLPSAADILMRNINPHY